MQRVIALLLLSPLLATSITLAQSVSYYKGSYLLENNISKSKTNYNGFAKMTLSKDLKRIDSHSLQFSPLSKKVVKIDSKYVLNPKTKKWEHHFKSRKTQGESKVIPAEVVIKDKQIQYIKTVSKQKEGHVVSSEFKRNSSGFDVDMQVIANEKQLYRITLDLKKISKSSFSSGYKKLVSKK